MKRDSSWLIPIRVDEQSYAGQAGAKESCFTQQKQAPVSNDAEMLRLYT